MFVQYLKIVKNKKYIYTTNRIKYLTEEENLTVLDWRQSCRRPIKLIYRPIEKVCRLSSWLLGESYGGEEKRTRKHKSLVSYFIEILSSEMNFEAFVTMKFVREIVV